ncbi:AAA domain-containing protein [Saccharolobus solfataricus]|uniref:AAA domain-containing protein n=1 Tax=Saccharolobus solfataricus TaxID=2287 RepID=UPI001E28F411|nr:AAA domain-containing protein [Saccharolobus solfataricus]
MKAIKFLISKLIGQDVGVISPYRTQVRKLDQELANYKPYVEVNTVDAFQGREKDVIIFSVTATNGLRFVTNRRRLNVAFTRPRYKLIVLGNENSIMSCQMTIC